MLLLSLGTAPQGCVPSICWAEDLSTQSRPLSSAGAEALMQELELPECSPHSSALASTSNVLCRGAGCRAALAFCGPLAKLLLQERVHKVTSAEEHTEG